MDEFECKSVKFRIADLNKIMKTSKFTETPYFFCAKLRDKVYMLATIIEEDRVGWVRHMRNVAVRKHCCLLYLSI